MYFKHKEKNVNVPNVVIKHYMETNYMSQISNA